MPEINYQYAIDYFSEQGARIGSLPVVPDWDPARECAQFLAIRRGIVAPVLRDLPGTIEPVWDTDLGPPVLSAARVVIAAEMGNDTVCEEVPTTAYFRSLAQKGSEVLVERGLLEKGDRYRFRICAYPATQANGDAGRDGSEGLDVEEVHENLRLDEQSIESFLASATAWGAEADPSDIPVFLPQQVIEEVVALSRESGDVETGGVLVGNLHRCPSSVEVFLEVTAQITAPHTDRKAGRLTFNADSWAAVRAAIELRRRDELMGGWWHYHPNFCRDCPEETRRQCVVSRPFFSADDLHLHHTVFSRAFQVALLVSDHGQQPMDVSLFGWRHGMVVSRGFGVLDAAEEEARAAR
jgi:hypothetical protein